MNLADPTTEFYWKIGVFGPFNACVMLAYKIFPCMELPLNLVYVILQDLTMWVEFRKQWRDVDRREVTLASLWQLIMNAGWKTSLYMFTFFGIHAVVIREFIIAKPEYCKELNQRLGFK